MRACTHFPPYESFTSLIYTPCRVLYNECKALFNYRINLPENDVDKWYSFADYLRHYNLSDVKPTALAMMSQFSRFYRSFKISPFNYLTLPAYSKAAMFSLYNKNSPNIFTLYDKNSVKTFRKNIVGGLVNVYKRCVVIGPSKENDSNFPIRARMNIDGKIIICSIIKYYIHIKCI